MRHSAALIVLAGLGISGCGKAPLEVPELIPVSGVVLLKGKPLPKASIIFISEEKGGVSAGRTDDLGKYTLLYAQNAEPGAVTGRHRVEIRTGGEIFDASGKLVSETQEILPERFNSNSTLYADVGSVEQPVNFDLR
jgi:hypothetical protein